MAWDEDSLQGDAGDRARLCRLQRMDQMVRPTASATARHRVIVSLNCSGVSDWAPSLSASAGSGWTSMIKPSQSAATAAAAMVGTSEAMPVPWLGSMTIGRRVRSRRYGTVAGAV